MQCAIGNMIGEHLRNYCFVKRLCFFQRCIAGINHVGIISFRKYNEIKITQLRVISKRKLICFTHNTLKNCSNLSYIIPVEATANLDPNLQYL